MDKRVKLDFEVFFTNGDGLKAKVFGLILRAMILRIKNLLTLLLLTRAC